jgi:3D (Asp-Asp-Asp) domain-containing protein
MKTDGRLSFEIIRKIVFISIVLVCLLGLGVFASKSEMNYITIRFPDEEEITVLTAKTGVDEILGENHIIVLPDEEVYPSESDKIDFSKTITISKANAKKKIVAEEVESVSSEEILGKYVKIAEKIITEQVEIPYETITKDVSTEGSETKDSVIQQGVNGIKEIKYKVRYQDEVEIDRTVISEEVIKEPVNKIVQISNNITSRAGTRVGGLSPEVIASSADGKEPVVRTLNASAYCSCAKCCGKSNGVTSSGNIAREWHTVAAGSGYPMGTVIYIPAFADQPNGGWFVVEDRGGAISNNKLDVFMGSHQAAIQFGRKNLECYIYYQ